MSCAKVFQKVLNVGLRLFQDIRVTWEFPSQSGHLVSSADHCSDIPLWTHMDSIVSSSFLIASLRRVSFEFTFSSWFLHQLTSRRSLRLRSSAVHTLGAVRKSWYLTLLLAVEVLCQTFASFHLLLVGPPTSLIYSATQRFEARTSQTLTKSMNCLSQAWKKQTLLPVASSFKISRNFFASGISCKT